MGSTRMRWATAGALAACVGAGGFAAGRLTHVEQANAGQAETAPAAAEVPRAAPTEHASAAGLPSFAGIVSDAAPAVVHVRTVSVVNAADVPDGDDDGPLGQNGPLGPNGPFHGFRMPRDPRGGGGGQTARAMGSGFIIRKDGIVLTNNHVVEHAKEITVALSDGRELSAKVLGRDPKTDLAVLKVDSKDALPVAKLGDSDGLAVGDWVVAIGNTFGLNNTVTAGIVSAKGRAIGQGPYDHFIQTDASINPGNSGGPLFDEHGNVVGINTAIFSQGGGNIGIGFAIPINMAKELVPQLEENGHVTRGWLGVSIQKLTPDLAESMGIADAHGALVAGVTPDSPAAKAGLAAGDVISRWDGKAVSQPEDLSTLVAGTAVGKTVSLEVRRDGKPRDIEVTVAKLAEEEVASDGGEQHRGRWGLALRDLTPNERHERELEPGTGVLVTEVAPDSPAADAQVKAGDVILQVNRHPVGSVDTLRSEVGKTADGKPLLLLVHPSEGGSRFAALAAR
jgi:serine protease Do